LPADTAISILHSDAFVNLHWGWGINIGGDGFGGSGEGGCGGGTTAP
jgi:hypothetical protein